MDSGRTIYLKTTYIPLPFSMMWATIKELKHVDIVHLTSLFYPPSWIIALVNWLFFHKPLVWSVRGELDKKALSYKTVFKKGLLILIKLINTKIAFHSTSQEETRVTKQFFSSARTVVEIPNFLELPNRVQRDETTPAYLLFIGRIHPIKAIDHLIEGLHLSTLFKKSQVSLKIAGEYENDYGRELQKQVVQLGLKDKIHFVGQLLSAEKEQCYANALFTFMPSHTENFGNVVVESLAQETPVVASLGTPWQILEEKQAGFWTANTPSVLAAIIDQILTLSPSTYAHYRTNAYTLVAEHFDVHKNIYKWVDTYRNLLLNEK